MLSDYDISEADKATSQSSIQTKYKVANKHNGRTSAGLEVMLQQCTLEEAMKWWAIYAGLELVSYIECWPE